MIRDGRSTDDSCAWPSLLVLFRLAFSNTVIDFGVCSRTQRDDMQQNHMLLPPRYKHCCFASRVRAPFDLAPKLACPYRRIPFNFSQSHMLKCKRRVSNLVKTASKASKEYACQSGDAAPFSPPHSSTRGFIPQPYQSTSPKYVLRGN